MAAFCSKEATHILVQAGAFIKHNVIVLMCPLALAVTGQGGPHGFGGVSPFPWVVFSLAALLLFCSDFARWGSPTSQSGSRCLSDLMPVLVLLTAIHQITGKAVETLAAVTHQCKFSDHTQGLENIMCSDTS